MLKTTVFKGAKIQYEKKGKAKRTVVLLHGFLESHKIWDDYLRFLSKKNTVIAISLPGHGASDCLGYVHSMEEMADVVKHVLHDNNKRKAIFIGHSMGGYVALAFGDKFPDAVNGLCLFNSTATADSKVRKVFRDRAIKVVKHNHALFIKEVVPNLFIEERTPALRGAMKRILNIAIKTPKQGIVAALEGMKNRPNREIILNFAPYPVLCLGGKHDSVVSWEDLERQSKLSERGVFHLSETGGHMCFVEDKIPCLTVLDHFIVSCKKL
jgi:pimeloyl-ACP methyl ester carboxylesterase